jgi:hypothetical protein
MTKDYLIGDKKWVGIVFNVADIPANIVSEPLN